jgi:hypothetical protein
VLALAFAVFGYFWIRKFFFRAHFSPLDGFWVREKFLRARLSPFGVIRVRENSLRARLFPFGIAKTPCVHVYPLLGEVRVRENSSFTPFSARVVFARTSCVYVYSLFGEGRVRENFLRARLLPFGQGSRSRELLACTFTPFSARFAFARTSCVHVHSLLGEVRVRENFLRARLFPFGQGSRSRELLACAFTPFSARVAFARTSCVHVYSLFGEVAVREKFLRTRFPPFAGIRVRENLIKRPFAFISKILAN